MCPEGVEVDGDRGGAHAAVEFAEDFGAGGFVGDGEGAVDRPVVVDGAAGGGDGSEGLLEALTVSGLLAEFDVSEEAEAGAAPVGAGPGWGMVETAVAVAWIALRHVADHVGPDELLIELAGLHAGDGFDVDGSSFFEPVVFFGERGEGGVDELVGHHPVVAQLVRSCVFADADAGEGW